MTQHAGREWSKPGGENAGVPSDAGDSTSDARAAAGPAHEWTTVLLNRDVELAYLVLIKGTRLAPHQHAGGAHYLTVVRGQALVWVSDTLVTLRAGDFVEIPPATIHDIGASREQDLVAFCVTQPPADRSPTAPESTFEIDDAFAEGWREPGAEEGHAEW